MKGNTDTITTSTCDPGLNAGPDKGRMEQLVKCEKGL